MNSLTPSFIIIHFLGESVEFWKRKKLISKGTMGVGVEVLQCFLKLLLVCYLWISSQEQKSLYDVTRTYLN